MTNEEKQELVDAVLESLRLNSRRIEDLTEVQAVVGTETIEIDGGSSIFWLSFHSGKF